MNRSQATRSRATGRRDDREEAQSGSDRRRETRARAHREQSISRHSKSPRKRETPKRVGNQCPSRLLRAIRRVGATRGSILTPDTRLRSLGFAPNQYLCGSPCSRIRYRPPRTNSLLFSSPLLSLFLLFFLFLFFLFWGSLGGFAPTPLLPRKSP